MKKFFTDCLKSKGYYLMTIFIMIQTGIFFFFTIMFFQVSNDYDNYLKTYICLVLALYLAFMYHFAYHSIKYAYFYELIAFLIMSILSSYLTCYNFIVYVVLQNDKLYYQILGGTCVILLLIGNIIYFMSAYYAYSIFEEKHVGRLGAKQSNHSLFSYMQLNNSVMKCDLGLMIFLLLTTFKFDMEDVILVILDSLVTIVFFINVYYMRKSMRNENKFLIYSILIERFLVQGYKIFREFMLLKNEELSLEINSKYKIIYLSIIASSITDFVILLIIIISAIKCILNFGYGLKETLIKQSMLSISTKGIINDDQ